MTMHTIEVRASFSAGAFEREVIASVGLNTELIRELEHRGATR